LLLVLAGCTRANPLSINGDGGVDTDGGGSECATLHDRASCQADPNCIALGCPQCDGTESFIGCFDKNGPLPGIGCPAGLCPMSCHGLDQQSCAAAASRGCMEGTCCGQFIECLDPTDPPQICAADCVNVCAGLDATTCKQNPACRADYCPGCAGEAFYQCNPATAPLPQCPPPPPCPPPPQCDQWKTQADCDSTGACHSVFEPGACGCANCCCTFFSRCADGTTANCKGPAACNIAPPDCGNPACNGMFAVGYSNLCYEGCVLATACGP
jgi:hypothetical protein